MKYLEYGVIYYCVASKDNNPKARAFIRIGFERSWLFKLDFGAEVELYSKGLDFL
jgi:hypothetical protein